MIASIVDNIDVNIGNVDMEEDSDNDIVNILAVDQNKNPSGSMEVDSDGEADLFSNSKKMIVSRMSDSMKQGLIRMIIATKDIDDIHLISTLDGRRKLAKKINEKYVTKHPKHKDAVTYEKTLKEINTIYNKKKHSNAVVTIVSPSSSSSSSSSSSVHAAVATTSKSKKGKTAGKKVIKPKKIFNPVRISDDEAQKRRDIRIAELEQIEVALQKNYSDIILGAKNVLTQAKVFLEARVSLSDPYFDSYQKELLLETVRDVVDEQHKLLAINSAEKRDECNLIIKEMSDVN
jgi:hypothetical protein